MLSGNTVVDETRRQAVVLQLIAQEAVGNDMAAIAQWRCALDGERPARTPAPEIRASSRGVPRPHEQSLGTGQSYVISLEIETDFDLYLSSGSDPDMVAAHVAALTGALSRRSCGAT